MKVGDMVKINSYCDYHDVWGITGVVLKIAKRHAISHDPVIDVLIEGKIRQFGKLSLDVLLQSGRHER